MPPRVKLASSRTSSSTLPPGDEAIALAKLVDSMPNLKLRGLLSYDGGAQHIMGFAARKERAINGLDANVKVYEAMKAAGLSTEIFSGGGTGTYSVQHLTQGFTDVQVGSYIFMDMQYLAIGSEDGDPVYKDFQPSLTVLGTVLNNRFPGRLTTDAGAKALTINVPRAGVVGEPGFDYNAGSDEFGVITYTDASRTYKIGDRVEMIVPHCDPVVNLYDVIYGTRQDRVETVWRVDARGRSQQESDLRLLISPARACQQDDECEGGDDCQRTRDDPPSLTVLIARRRSQGIRRHVAPRANRGESRLQLLRTRVAARRILCESSAEQSAQDRRNRVGQRPGRSLENRRRDRGTRGAREWPFACNQFVQHDTERPHIAGRAPRFAAQLFRRQICDPVGSL
jgi:hypothetical protein